MELDGNKQPLADQVYEVHAVNFRIPTGSFNYTHTLKGMGLKCGEEKGDAHIQLMVRPHPKFKMESPHSRNIMSNERVPLDIMLAGGEVDFPTMYGLKAARIPAGSKDGDRIRIKCHGVSGIGDHIIILSAIYPTKDDLKNKPLWKGLNINWDEEDDSSEQQAGADQDLQDYFKRILEAQGMRFIMEDPPNGQGPK